MTDRVQLDLEDLYNDIQTAHKSLIYAIQTCIDAREFCTVAKMAIDKNNPQLAATILDVLISRIDPILQNYYQRIPEHELIDVVQSKMATQPVWPFDPISDDEIFNDTDDDKETPKA